MPTDTENFSLPQAWLGEFDVWLLAAGKHLRPWKKLGAHPSQRAEAAGTAFAVWAPNACEVSVVGDFNHWNARAHPMQHRPECRAWRVFVPGVAEGTLHKFPVLGADDVSILKTDPCALRTESGSGDACIVMQLPEPVQPPPGQRGTANALAAPMSVYEVHGGSWRRPDAAWPDWPYLIQTLVPYVVEMGFTHLELMPVNEHPFCGSWGYQPTGLYAPSARYGSRQEFRDFVATAHAAGLQVLLDWVPAHFPADADALARFDGTAQYEHADPRESFLCDWNTLIYKYSRHEVRNFLVDNALFWIERYGIDDLRVDAVASMLYRDYSRAEGEWIPSKDGGRENYEAIAFQREVNHLLGQEAPGAITVAEESTAFPGVTGPHGTQGWVFTTNGSWAGRMTRWPTSGWTRSTVCTIMTTSVLP